jgi:antitoxin ParD1/3/4
MANVEKISVALTPEMAATIREVVSSGEYASASEVMREALRDWKHRRKQRDEAIVELKRMVQEGIDSGLGEDGETFFNELLADLKRKGG